VNDALLDHLRASRVVGRYFEPDGSLTFVGGGSDVDPPEGDGGDAPLNWPSAADVVPDDQVTTEPEPEDDGETPPADPPAAPPAAPEGETPPPEGTPPPADGGLEALPQSWQDTIRDLRKENGDYRVQYKALDEVFGAYGPDERAKFLDLAAGLADESRHEETAREFIAIGKRILENYGVDVGDLAAPDPNAPMTRAQYEAAERQRRQEADIEKNMERITEKVKSLGYELGSLDHYALLRAANEQQAEGPPDWDAAHARVQSWKKGIIDGFIAEHSKKAGSFPPTAPQTGSAPAEMPDELPEDREAAFALARKQFNAMLDG
jgi:hypothetical protein